MSFTLGTQPTTMTVFLSADADFVASMTSTTGAWPWEQTILKFVDRSGAVVASWAADISGAVASWNVDANVVASVIASKGSKVRLHLVDGDGVDLLWATGPATVT